MRMKIAMLAFVVGSTVFALNERVSAHLHPGLGRFVQRDPIGYAEGMSLYEYLLSNAPRYRDSRGTDTQEEKDRAAEETDRETNCDKYAFCQGKERMPDIIGECLDAGIVNKADIDWDTFGGKYLEGDNLKKCLEHYFKKYPKQGSPVDCDGDCPAGTHKIAAETYNDGRGRDYHYYTQLRDKTWRHKVKNQNAKKCDKPFIKPNSKPQGCYCVKGEPRA